MPKSRRRKRPQPRPARRTAPLTWQGQLLQEVRPFLEPGTTRHQVEVWASSELARACPRLGLLGRVARDRWVADVIQYAGRRRTRESAALVAALSTVSEDSGLGIARGAWADALLADVPWACAHAPRPAAVTRVEDVWSDVQTWFLHYDDHVLAVITARSAPWHVAEVRVIHRDAPNRYDRLAQADQANLLHPRTEVPLDDALSTLRLLNEAPAVLLRWGSGRTVHPLGHLLTARLALAEPRSAELIEDEREDLLAACEAEVSGNDGWLVADAGERLLDFAERSMAGDPLAWSPALVEEFLLECVPNAWDLEPDEVPALPRATAVWVRWALLRRGLPRELAEATAAYALTLSQRCRDACEDELIAQGYEPEDLPWPA